MTRSDNEIDAQFESIVGPPPPEERFAAAFALPTNTSADLRSLHSDIVESMRREAANLPMSTVQTLLLERIAYYYITMKSIEFSNERVNPARLSDMNKQWRDMTTEFNRQMNSSHMRLREALIQDVVGITNDGLALIKDQENRREVRTFFSSRFEEIGE